MAFTSMVVDDHTGPCDACKKNESKEILVELVDSQRTQKDIILIHPSCFNRIVMKYNKRLYGAVLTELKEG
jgi:hypothetical protein